MGLFKTETGTFAIGQPVWVTGEYCCKEDHRTFIILDFFLSFLGRPMAAVVPDDRLTAVPLHIPLRYLTDTMPRFMEPHPEHSGTIRHTATGRMIKAIDGGRQ